MRCVPCAARFSRFVSTTPSKLVPKNHCTTIYIEKLSWSQMSMDPAGIPRVRGRLTGNVYNPAYIAWWGLVNLGHFLRHRDHASRDIFLNQVSWLESEAVIRSDGAVVWPNNFDCLQGATSLKRP